MLLVSIALIAFVTVYSQVAPVYPGQPGTVQPGTNPPPGDNVLPNQQPGSVPSNGIPNPQQPGTIQPNQPTPNLPGTPGMTGNNGTGSQGSSAPPSQNPGPGNGGFPNNPNGLYPGNRGVSGPTGKN